MSLSSALLLPLLRHPVLLNLLWEGQLLCLGAHLHHLDEYYRKGYETEVVVLNMYLPGSGVATSSGGSAASSANFGYDWRMVSFALSLCLSSDISACRITRLRASIATVAPDSTLDGFFGDNVVMNATPCHQLFTRIRYLEMEETAVVPNGGNETIRIPLIVASPPRFPFLSFYFLERDERALVFIKNNILSIAFGNLVKH
jgi:hypothetical protein